MTIATLQCSHEAEMTGADAPWEVPTASERVREAARQHRVNVFKLRSAFRKRAKKTANEFLVRCDKTPRGATTQALVLYVLI